MIRLAVFLGLTAALAFLAAWLADRPGEVTITWLGYRADTSVAVLIGAVAALAVLMILAWSLASLVVRSPRLMASTWAQRRSARGQSAIAGGLFAVGAGDVSLARRFAAEAGRLAADQPLQLLLQAQCAQLAGDGDAAEAAFRAMAERADTKLFGLHGLFIEARRRNDVAAAREFAEAAARASPSLAWAGQAALDFRCMDGDWAGALDALDRNREGGLVDTDPYRRQRAVLLTARALSLGEDDRAAASSDQRDAAIGSVLEAVKLCPGLVPAAALAGRLLAQAGERRKAERMLEAAWRANPHPDIAEAYADLPPGASARERLARVRALARLAAGHRESAFALAMASFEAHEFAEARASLVPLLAVPTKRVATLMAKLEEVERGDIGRAREWMARAVNAAHDPAWTADGLVAERWMPVSPVTGRLDAFQWRVPVADLAPRGRAPLIETSEPVPQALSASPSRPLGEAAVDVEARREAPPATPSPAVVPQPSSPAASAAAEPLPKAASRSAAGPAPAAILPVHAPDDPGPVPDAAQDPVLRAAPKPKPRKSQGWRSWFSRAEEP